MKKISWISCDAFIDTDLPIVVRLQHYYQIRLILVCGYNCTIDYKPMVTKELGTKSNVDFLSVQCMYRQKSIKSVSTYYNIIRLAKTFNPDIFYIAFQGIPYALFLYKMLLPLKRCIVPCHNVSTPKGARMEKIAVWTTHWWLKTFKNINVFSIFQEKILKSKYNKNVLYTPFFLKNYGETNMMIDKTSSKTIVFLSFGNIGKYKRIDLLIKASNILVERGMSNFVVRIAGNCKNWLEYKQLIKYPDFVQTDIRRIPNEDIPGLFEYAHYFVLPYQDIAQSGSITIAFNYNVPTIVSDIPQFKEFVKDGVTSLSFKSEDAVSLANTMQYAIEHHTEIYDSLRENQKKLVEEKFSGEAIVKKYRDFFDEIIDANDK